MDPDDPCAFPALLRSAVAGAWCALCAAVDADRKPIRRLSSKALLAWRG
jgi:hypothetical protein